MDKYARDFHNLLDVITSDDIDKLVTLKKELNLYNKEHIGFESVPITLLKMGLRSSSYRTPLYLIDFYNIQEIDTMIDSIQRDTYLKEKIHILFRTIKIKKIKNEPLFILKEKSKMDNFLNFLRIK